MRRLLVTPLTVLGVVVLVFAVLHLVPGDPIDVMLGESAAPTDRIALRHALGLDRPLTEQLLGFVAGVAHGELGWSVAYRAPVAELIARRWPATLELAAAAFVLAAVVALPAGVIAAVRAGGRVDRLVRVVSLLGLCVPAVWLGPLLILVFALWLDWLPVSGRGGPAHLVLPAATLACGMAAVLVRLTRAATIHALHGDAVRTARAKGAPAWRVVVVHALRPALPPVVTVLGLQAGALLAGTVVTETIFAWPGLGRLAVQGIGARDYPLVQGCLLVVALTYVAVNLVTDLVCAWLDPRVRDDA